MFPAAHHHFTPQQHANEANHFSKNIREGYIPIVVIDMEGDPNKVGQSAGHCDEKSEEIPPRMLREDLIMISALSRRFLWRCR